MSVYFSFLLFIFLYISMSAFISIFDNFKHPDLKWKDYHKRQRESQGPLTQKVVKLMESEFRQYHIKIRVYNRDEHRPRGLSPGS